eukprot:1160614-Pelagomonas_calceolata.AAC.4
MGKAFRTIGGSQGSCMKVGMKTKSERIITACILATNSLMPFKKAKLSCLTALGPVGTPPPSGIPDQNWQAQCVNKRDASV